MPRRVDELTLHKRNVLSNQSYMITIDPVDNEVYRTPVAEFRGAQTFVSANPPGNKPEDTQLPNYLPNDTFYHITGNGIELFVWDEPNKRWVSKGFIDGARIWTSQILVGNASLLTNTDVAYKNVLVKNGDWFHNPVRGIMYGPYDATNGFNFATTDPNKVSFLRSDHVNEFTSLDDDKIQQPLTDPDFKAVILAAVTNANHKMWMPKDGDVLHIKAFGSGTHGGKKYVFSLTRFMAAPGGSSHIEKVIAGFCGSDPLLNWKYAREAAVFVQDTAPTWNNSKYRKGDAIVDSGRGLIYQGYKELAVQPATLVDNFESVLTMKGNVIWTTDLEPGVDDSKYATGDYIISQSHKTPRMHGPYVPGKIKATEAWPLTAVLRAPMRHAEASNIAPTTAWAGDYPVHKGAYIVKGDLWEMVYSADKQVYLSTGAVLNNVAKTIVWGTAKTHAHPTRNHVEATKVWPLKDDLKYYQGDMIENESGDVHGPYVEGAADDQAAWKYFRSTRAQKIVATTSPVAPTFTPSGTNGSPQWGSVILKTFDQLQAPVASTTTSKALVFDAKVSADGTAITWLNRRSLHGVRFFSSPLFTQPVKSDADYTNGDFMDTASGLRYGPYQEGKGADTAAWPFYGTVRGPSRLVIDRAFDWLPSTDSSGRKLNGVDTLMHIGDEVIVNVTGSTRNKQRSFMVTQVDVSGNIQWSAPRNPNESKLHAVSVMARPDFEDKDYWAGDTAIIKTGAVFGPYIEGQTTKEDAWPDFVTVSNGVFIFDKTTGEKYELSVDNGNVEFLKEVP